jgi:hypothetical protein
VAFPRQVLENTSNDYSALYTDPELTRRALTLYVVILHRLGFRLFDSVSGSFDLLSRKDGYADFLPHELFENKQVLHDHGQLLERVLRSLVLIGFPHYTIYLHNCIHRLHLGNDKLVSTGWMSARLDYMTEDLILLDRQHKESGSGDNFIEWIQSWRSNDFRKEFQSPEGVDEYKQKPITFIGSNKNNILFCDHGVYMRTAVVPGSSQKMFLCQIEVQKAGSGYSCDKKYPCR